MDQEILDMGVGMVEKKEGGDRCLKIPDTKLVDYAKFVKAKLSNGFWNEIVGADKIIFVFKLKDGSVGEYELSLENESKIGELCAEFTGENKDKTANVYKYIAANKFYHDFMYEHYSDMINRE